MKEFWVCIANRHSVFDFGTIVQEIDQLESDSYFRGVGLIDGTPTVVDKIFFDDLDFQKFEIEDIEER